MTPQASQNSVGVRELHNKTSELLGRVADGQELTITSHGKPLAKLVPIRDDDPLEDLRRRGILIEPTGERRPLPEPIVPSRTGPGQISDFVSEQRG